MAEDKKSRSKTINKIFIIGGSIFAVLLTIVGIIAVNQSKEKGTDSVLSNESDLVDKIYNESQQPLTDDQFYEALDKIFPKDDTLTSEKRATIYQIEERFSSADIAVMAAYFNNYGKPGYRLYTKRSINDIIPLLDFSICSEYYVHVLDEDALGILGAYRVNSDGVFIRMEQGMDIGSEESLDNIADLTSDLKEQYNIEKITLTDKALVIYSYNVSTADLLNAFDYVYQWCLQNECDRQLFFYASDRLVIATDTSLADDFYKNNYPTQELAAIFRLNYYSTKCFFGRAVQDACDLYL